MNKKLLSILSVTFFLASLSKAQTVWNGPATIFTKAAFADPTLAANQDRITTSTWITRGSTQGIYNRASESSYSHSTSPANTEWATGSLANYTTLTYQPWETWAGGSPNIPLIVGMPAVLHLIAENIYIGITFTSWGSTAGGGGNFSYQRTTANVVAPVRLVNFSAAKKNNGIQLNWKTVSEENTSFFSIERSNNGRDFISIGNVTAAGNSSSEKDYAFADLVPSATNFYRLKTSDKDGKFSYSNVVAFKLAKKAFDVFPVPASNFLNVQINSPAPTGMHLTDLLGRIVKSVTVPGGENAFTIDISNLKPGVYNLKTAGESKMIVKE